MKRGERRGAGECVLQSLARSLKEPASALCFKVQSVALNSPGFPQKSLSLFVVAPGSETGRFIWFYRGTKELLCSTAPFPLNGLCDKTNFDGVKCLGSWTKVVHLQHPTVSECQRTGYGHAERQRRS